MKLKWYIRKYLLSRNHVPGPAPDTETKTVYKTVRSPPVCGA